MKKVLPILAIIAFILLMAWHFMQPQDEEDYDDLPFPAGKYTEPPLYERTVR